tara:strand:+ start:505 stop:1170 length:666 start_codon:yes stop_codon:yes gene_type:complete
MPKALIFDFDGLILDTEVPIYEAWRENFRAHGQELPIEIYAQCVGSNFGRFDPKQHLQSLVGEKIDWNALDHKREQNALDRTNQLTPFPGVITLLKEANDADIPCIVASSSSRAWVEGHLNRLGLMHHFIGTRCFDDVENPKPAPDLFLAAAQAVKADPADALVFEDSLNGLNASIAAGIPCVIVPNQITSHFEFEGAAKVIPSLEGIFLSHFSDLRTNNR